MIGKYVGNYREIIIACSYQVRLSTRSDSVTARLLTNRTINKGLKRYNRQQEYWLTNSYLMSKIEQKKYHMVQVQTRDTE